MSGQADKSGTSFLDRRFGLTQHGTNVRTEFVAAVTTFLTMVYIVFVNPVILANAGMDKGAVFVATCLAASVSTLAMAFLANYPIALAPGMGLNAFFAFTVVLGYKYTWQQALAAVFCSGVIFFALSVFRLREYVIDAIPRNLKFAISAGVGLALGVVVAKSRVLRSAIGSMITGLQTMPSIAWFPLAILLFQLSEQAILFVILIGAVPSIANGVITGVDYVPGLLVRAGRNLGARGLALYRHVVLPAALPSITSGLKQGWAFAWRSLLAGELLVAIANRPSLGVFLTQSRELQDTTYMIALMITILVIGIAVDAVFAAVDRGIRARRGVATR
jgi:ABC-type nitrate/sulfonate/bicarbonate transport system permease component